MTYTPDEPINAIAAVSDLYQRFTTPIVVPAKLAIELFDLLDRLGSDRLSAELAQCPPLFDVKETHTGLGDK